MEQYDALLIQTCCCSACLTGARMEQEWQGAGLASCCLESLEYAISEIICLGICKNMYKSAENMQKIHRKYVKLCCHMLSYY